jgi:hypothetical protein
MMVPISAAEKTSGGIVVSSIIYPLLRDNLITGG